tara:strand:- start:1672 stop:3702 length:2031 start_codon:yes stop_codon:yes gene_type:complete
MALIPIDNVGQVGIVKETSPWQLPPNVWSDGNNVKTDEGSIRKLPGYAEVMATCPVAPYLLTQLTLGIPEFWIVGGLTKIYVYDNTNQSTLLDGGINDSVTTVTVDSTSGFEDIGTILIGDEQITYTAKTATTFTTCTRGANSTSAAAHSDDVSVSRANVWYDVTRASGDYSTTAAENWTSTIIGGVLVMTNGFDDPQYWALTDGIPLSTTKMQDLNNWPSLTILDGAITSTSATTAITVDSTATFPITGTFTIDSEDISYTGVTSTTFTGISRAQNGTTGATHLDDAPVFVNVYCRSMRAFRTFLVGLYVQKAGVNFPRLVKWSTEASIQSTPTSWNETDSTVDAGEYELADTKGDILDGLQLRDAFMIYKEDATYSMQFVGVPFIFSFRQLSPTIGAIAKNCVAEFDGGHAIFGKGNFYINDGQRLKPILPQKLKEYVFTQIDGDQVSKSFVAADYGRNEILFCYVSDGSIGNQCDQAVVWNYVTNTFVIRNLPDLAHMGYGVIRDPTRSSAWEDSTNQWNTIFGPWTTSFDSTDKVLLFASPTNTKLYRNGSGNKEDTTDMTSFVERSGLSMNEQGVPDHSSVKRITAIYPKMTVSSTNLVNIYVGSQMSTEEGISWKTPVQFTPDTQSKVSVRATGKFYAVKFESTTDMDWELDGYSIEVEDAGRRGSRMAS